MLMLMSRPLRSQGSVMTSEGGGVSTTLLTNQSSGEGGSPDTHPQPGASPGQRGRKAGR